MRSKTGGFHIVEVVLAVALVGLLGFIGLRVWQANHQTATKTGPQTASVPAVKTTKDLEAADTFVNQVDTSSDLSDLTKMDQELNSL